MERYRSPEVIAHNHPVRGRVQVMVKGDTGVESALATPELSAHYSENKMMSKIQTLPPGSARTNGENVGEQ